MQDTVTMLMLLAGGLAMMWFGFGKLTGFWGNGSTKEGGSGMNAQKFVAIVVVGLFGIVWLSAPASQAVMHDTIVSAWAHFVNGVVVPVATIVGQVLVVGAIGVIAYCGFRRWRSG